MKDDLSKRYLVTIRCAELTANLDERLGLGELPIIVNSELIKISHLFTTARRVCGMESLQNPVSNIQTA